MPVVGIPRALLYYQYYPMWRAFFTTLGAEVVVSPATSKAIVSTGAARLVSETCLPTKVFCGHVMALQGKADFVFVPAIRSLEEQVYNCSKFLGLPDLVQGTIAERPEVLTIDIDVNLGKGSVFHQLHKLGSRFTRNPLKIKQAVEAALAADGQYKALLLGEQLTMPEALERLYGAEVAEPEVESTRFRYDLRRPLSIAVIGHPYNTYDGYITHNLLRRLRSWGVRVLTTEMATDEELDAGTLALAGRHYWTYEDEVIGAAGHYMNSSAVAGVISIVAFACGPDSVMVSQIQRAAKLPGANPYLGVTVDEHTGEAGLVTRLEAFIDMLARRKGVTARAAVVGPQGEQ
ncbi:MAG: acyl-CoA dehydratase activase-related protein [Chloroflexota bacterium]